MAGTYIVTLSSVGTAQQNLDWMGSKPVSVAVTLGSTTMTTDFQIQCTLDDFQTSTGRVWVPLSTTHYTSAIADTGALLSAYLGPLAGIRISSTAISSSSIIMRVAQGVGG